MQKIDLNLKVKLNISFLNAIVLCHNQIFVRSFITNLYPIGISDMFSILKYANSGSIYINIRYDFAVCIFIFLLDCFNFSLE